MVHIHKCNIYLMEIYKKQETLCILHQGLFILERGFMKYSFMLRPLSKVVFDKMFECKLELIEPVLKTYKVQPEDLKNLLWKEFNIPGMEVRIANTAFNVLIRCCEKKEDLCESLLGEVRHVILTASGVSI